MGILIEGGITVGRGIVIGGGTAPSPTQTRLVGAPSTNVAQTYTRTGTPTTVTTPTPAIGTSSGNFSGSGRFTIQTVSPTPTMTNVGSGDWTFESWFQFATVPSAAVEFFTTEITGGLSIRLGQSFGTTINALSVFARGGSDMNYAPITWVAGTWYYITVQKSGSTISMWVGAQGASSASYIGGTLFQTANAGTATFVNANNTGGCIVGGYNGTSVNSQTRINMICWSNVARYSNTTAPIFMPSAFPIVDQYTTQLLEFQGANGGTTFTNETS